MGNSNKIESIGHYYNRSNLDITSENNARMLIGFLKRQHGDVFDEEATEFVFQRIKITADKVADNIENDMSLYGVISELSINYNSAMVYLYLKERGLIND